MLIKSLFLILFLITLSACSQQKKTAAEFSVTIAGITGQMPGGVMVYGHNSTKSQMFAKALTTSSLSLELQNGSWSFYAIGWNGANKLTGTARCASSNVVLDGKPVAVNLVMTVSQCNSATFSPLGFVDNSEFQELKIYSCTDISGAGSAADCSSVVGEHQSMEVVLVGYEGSSITPIAEQSIRSGCVSVTSGEALTNIRLPLGGTTFPVAAQIHAYASAGCTGSLKNIYEFQEGVSQSLSTASWSVYDGMTGPDFTKIFLLSNIVYPVPVISYAGAAGVNGVALGAMSVAPTTLNGNGSAITNCSITPSLPAGLTINTVSCVISGTPTVTDVSGTTYTVTATNTTSGQSTATVLLTIVAPTPTLMYPGGLHSGEMGNFISIMPTTILGGNGSIVSNCFVAGLPTGLSIDPSTCEISGTPGVVTGTQNYTVTIENNLGGSSTTNISIEINPPLPVISYAAASGTVGQVNNAMSVAPTTFSIGGGDSISNCSSTPSLPAGLTINNSTCVITGIPTTITAATLYTITAIGSLGGQQQATVTLQVLPQSPTISYRWALGTNGVVSEAMSITPTTLNANGGSITNCQVTPALPAGLVINTTTCVINGTPTTNSAVTTYTVTASNEGGSTNTTLKLLTAPALMRPWGPITNSTLAPTVNAIKVQDDIAYIGGNFQRMGQSVGSVFISQKGSCEGLNCLSSGIANINRLPYFVGDIKSAVSDGANGYYIVGKFNILNTNISNLAHILSDGSVDLDFNIAYDPNIFSTSLAIYNDKLIVSGNFTSIGGESRTKLAAINLADNSILPFDGAPSHDIYKMKRVGNSLYVCGEFTSILGQARNRVAKIDLATLTLEAFDPTDPVIDAAVIDIAVDAGKVFLTGYFTTGKVKAFDEITSAHIGSFNPVVTGYFVGVLEAYNGVLYIGGDFTNVDGHAPSQPRLAAFNTTTFAIIEMPTPNSEVSALEVVDGMLYVGGDFSTIGGQERLRMAVIDISNHTVSATSPNLQLGAGPNGSTGFVRTIVDGGSSVLVGGQFSFMGGVERLGLAAIDLATNQLTTFNPGVSGIVNALEVISGDRLVIGGSFTSMAGGPRNYIGAVNLSDGSLDSFNPSSNGSITSLVFDGTDTLFVGGSYSNIGGQSRSNLAAIDVTTGMADAFNPSPNSQVMAMAINGTSLFIGGYFTVVAGENRGRIAEIDISSGMATSFASSGGADNNVNAIHISGTNVYFGGNFNNVDGSPRGRAAAYDLGGSLQTFNPNISGGGLPVYAMAMVNGRMYLAGNHGPRLSAHNSTTGVAVAFNYGTLIGGAANVLVPYGSEILWGGLTGLKPNAPAPQQQGLLRVEALP